MAAFLSLAMIIPLAAGVLTLVTGDDTPTTTLPTTTTTTIPDFVDAGRTLTVDTPCPATDGTEERTTTFATPPPICIDTTATYSAALNTQLGDIVLTIDPALDADAANLFIVMADYGFFDGLPLFNIIPDGLAISGDAGVIDAGFSIPATPVDGDEPYGVNSVVMFADTNGQMATRFGLITSQEVVDALVPDPAHPVIGEVTGGIDLLNSILADPGTINESIDTVIRIDSVSITTP